MVQVGRALIDHPQNVTFVHESHDSRFNSQLLMTKDEMSETQNLLQLTNQIRDAVVKVSNLRREVTRLEGEDPEGGDTSQNVTI